MGRQERLESAARALLDALELANGEWDCPAAIKALRAALDAPEEPAVGEPVACKVCGGGKYLISAALEPNRNRFHQKGCPGDTHPAQAPSPSSEVERAREAFTQVARQFCDSMEWDMGFSLDRDLYAAWQALLAAERAAGGGA